MIRDLMFSRWKANPAYPFVAPFVLFMVFLILEGIHPSAVYVLYPIKTVAVGVLILLVFSRLPDFNLNNPWLSAGIGILVFILWVGLGPFITAEKLGQSIGLGSWFTPSKTAGGFNPFLFQDKNLAWGLVCFRILGASLIVPVMEELFWRGFLMRYLINEDFEEVALGTYTHVSFWVVTVFFASIHGSLAPVALLTGIVYGFFFIRTKSLGNIILAHGVTNLCLGLYVLKTGQWFFW